MFGDRKFIKKLEETLAALSSSKNVDVQQVFKKFEDKKYANIIASLATLSQDLSNYEQDVQMLVQDSKMMNHNSATGASKHTITSSKYNNKNFDEIIRELNTKIEQNDQTQWIQKGISLLSSQIMGDMSIAQIGAKSLEALCNYVGAGVGVFYTYEIDSNALHQVAGFAFVNKEAMPSVFKMGEGVVGQVALQKEPIELKNIHKTHITIETGIGSEVPLHTYTFPLMYQNQLEGVVEIGSSLYFDEKSLEFFELASATIAVAIFAARQNDNVKKLLLDSENINALLSQQKEALDAHSIVGITDTNGNITYANAKFSEISGYTNEELIGSNHRILNSGTFKDSFWKEMYSTISSGNTWYHPAIKNKAKDGSFYWVATTIFPFIGSDGKPESYIAIRTDVTNAKHAEEKMKEQKEKLEETNRLMQDQQAQLEEANTYMEEQQQQLEEANSQMEEQQQQLTSYTLALEEKNENLKRAQKELDMKAQDLEKSNKFKSEFLANMSHELRTPLNSIILLSEMLYENANKHLDAEEVKKASIIHSSGNDLLRLVNDVLDLSKIEAGQMEIDSEHFDSSVVVEEFQNQFQYLAEEKNLEFVVIDNYKAGITNDKNKLFQILKNLISNAVKFTQEGRVVLQIDSAANSKVRFSVSDTGIGIEKEKSETIFEAFQQAEGGITRKYGGTGLGLSISKTLASLMGGNISLESEVGKGSTFTIIIPNLEEYITDIEPFNPYELITTKQKVQTLNSVLDDRKKITNINEVFLIIEDDELFAGILKEKINLQDEYVLIALSGKEGINLAMNYNIKGVLLDLGLPDMDGIDVLREFKTNPALRRIPIYVISGQNKKDITKEKGAFGFVQKPIGDNEVTAIVEKINLFNNKVVKDLLIVEDDKNHREALIEFIGNGTIKSKGVDTVASAIAELEKGIYDGVVIDLNLSDGSGYEICEYIYKAKSQIPIIVYTGSDLTTQEEKKLRKYTDSVIIKTANSQLKLLDEVDIFMHRVRVKTGAKTQNVHDIDLSNRKILVVDDDIRNIYVLSEALGSKGADVITASDGQEAIDVLSENVDTCIVLMDVMMPVMNGYDATKIIKNDPKLKDIPIIAVTAKAMDGDRNKALEAGCDDYVSKPIKMEILIGIIQGWLHKK